MLRTILIFTFLLSFLLNINAATITWIGGTGDWDEAFNWDTGMLPTISDDVIIVSNGEVNIPANYSALSRNLVISGELNIETGANLSVSLISGSVPICDCGIEVNVSGELTVNGNLTISASIGTSTFNVIDNKGTINNNGSIIIDGSKGHRIDERGPMNQQGINGPGHAFRCRLDSKTISGRAGLLELNRYVLLFLR
jgi:hypothetical protein